MSFDSELFDDILPQLSNAPERALGKFLPKARKKNEKVVQQSTYSDHPAQDGKRVSTVHAPKEILLAEGCTDVPRSPLCAKTADPSFNDCLQREQESSVEQIKIVVPGSDSLDDILPQLTAVTDGVMGKFHPKMRSSDSKFTPPSSSPTYTCRPLSSGVHLARHAPPLLEDPISDVGKEFQTDSQMSKGKESRESNCFESFEDSLLQASDASEAAAASGIDSDLQTDQGRSGEEAADMVTSLDLHNDFLIQSETAERAVGKFHPKLKSSRVTEKAVEAKRCTLNVESPDDIFSQPDTAIDSEARVPDHSVDSQADQGVPMSPALDAASPDEYRTLDCHGINERDVLNCGERHSLRRETFGESIGDHSQGILDGGGSYAKDFGVTDDGQTFRQLRKRPSVGTLADELDDGNEESWELGDERSNDSQMVEGSSDDEYMGQRSHKKRTTRKPKRFQDEKEKPTRVRKKMPCRSDSSKQEPQKKKFSHSTRRSRRRVDKVLLETPEEDIDPMQLKIKDLIMLAEAREQTATKEAAMMGQSTRDKRDLWESDGNDDLHESAVLVVE